MLQIRRVMSDDSEFWCFHLMDAEYVTSPSFRVTPISGIGPTICQFELLLAFLSCNQNFEGKIIW